MLLVGATPPGRHTEQHDVFFGIGETIRDLVPQVLQFWPEAKRGLHLDAWREVTLVNGYSVSVTSDPEHNSNVQLFFINLGGYKKGEFEEFHYKMIVAAPDKGEAVKAAKQTAFFRHTGFKGANAHIDDKYGVDVDDIYAIRDILPASVKGKYSLAIDAAAPDVAEDVIHLGYFKLDTVDKWAPQEVTPKEVDDN
ncbi:DUF1543 domain-containing protein [Paracnuella aquatica]|uniref:DUF1543 domain-containing protein n=1 Tax=Paracnuella aquatica TaxID=2268757 RepID=UPI000DF01521|nr:DUF1543 domain-containing protein [Paracnuella aquatica]RPD45075.1 DUF1543 domain-containing protein [Paracnuella aquatica]